MTSRVRFRSSILMGKGNDQTDAGIGKVIAVQSGLVTYPGSTAATAPSPAMTIPKGAVIEQVLVDINGQTGGTAPTVSFGNAADPDGLITAFTDANGATQYYQGSTAQGALWVNNTPQAADLVVVLTQGGTVVSTAGNARITVVYWLDPASIKDPSSE